MLKRVFRSRLTWIVLAAVALPLVVILIVASRPPAEVKSYGPALFVIHSYDSVYVIHPDGTVDVTEDIMYDFGEGHFHGIDRYIPVDYEYDFTHKRVIQISNVRVDDGVTKWPVRKIKDGPSLRLRIGEASTLVTGVQRYHITYRIQGALNSFDDHDELYWNATGPGWPLTIEKASAAVMAPEGSISGVKCFQGEYGTTQECPASVSGNTARFEATFPAGARFSAHDGGGSEEGRHRCSGADHPPPDGVRQHEAPTGGRRKPPFGPLPDGASVGAGRRRVGRPVVAARPRPLVR